LRAVAQMVAGRRNWVLLEACGWGEERRGGVPAFYRPRRLVWRRRYFPARRVAGGQRWGRPGPVVGRRDGSGRAEVVEQLMGHVAQGDGTDWPGRWR
jgi:hypothetical protein